MEPDSLREIVLAHTHISHHDYESSRFAGRALETFLYKRSRGIYHRVD